MHIALNCKHTLYIKVAYTNYFVNSLNIFTGKTLVLNFSVLFICLFMNGKLYSNNNLFLNKSIDLTSTSL